MSVSSHITHLAENEVFVFGSNLAGRHGAGAALTARQKFGAVYGQGAGLQGQSYAIPTKDENLEVLPLPLVRGYIREFVKFARDRPDLTFLVTEIGCGLAGHTPEQIGPWFYRCPENVRLPASFEELAQGRYAGLVREGAQIRACFKRIGSIQFPETDRHATVEEILEALKEFYEREGRYPKRLFLADGVDPRAFEALRVVQCTYFLDYPYDSLIMDYEGDEDEPAHIRVFPTRKCELID